MRDIAYFVPTEQPGPVIKILIRVDGRLQEFAALYTLCRQFDSALRYLLSAAMLLLVCSVAMSQEAADTVSLNVNDSVKVKVSVNTLRSRFEDFREDNMQKYREQSTRLRQSALMAELRRRYYQANDYLKHGVDSLRFEEELARLNAEHQLAISRIFDGPDTVLSMRHLTTTNILLHELLDRSEKLKDEVSQVLYRLRDLRTRIDSMSLDTNLYAIPSDTTLLKEYWDDLRKANEANSTIDSELLEAISTTRKIDTRADGLTSNIRNSIEGVEEYRFIMSRRSTSRLMAPWGKPDHGRDSLAMVTQVSVEKNRRVLGLYLSNNWHRVVLFCIFFIVIAYYLVTFRNRLRNTRSIEGLLDYKVILSFPLLVSAIVVLNIGQFFFSDVPFAFQALIWTPAAIFLSVILRYRWKRRYQLVWNAMVAVFIIVNLNNLVLIPSNTERIVMAFTALAAIVITGIYLAKPLRENRQNKSFNILAAASVIMFATSIYANATGRYNLAKVLLSSGIFGMVSATMIFWTARLIREILGLAREASGNAGNEDMRVKFEKLHQVAPDILYPVALIGWLVLFIRNFYLQHYVSTSLQDLLYSQRKVGDYTYTLESAFVFIVVILLSMLIAQVIAFFTSTGGRVGSSVRASSIGNWLLLIRIGIVSAGIIFAFLAAGIPIDKLTIIIGSLGVGIGFGLQSIVNNLFSGIILAFERPAQIGDLIEVGGIMGKVKEIGIRSSKIVTLDGSDVIIPNGDMLNQHLVNWTKGNRHRRMEMIIGVAYGSHLNEIRDGLEQILKNHPMVISYPSPLVYLHQFNESSMDFRLLFWADVERMLDLKSEISFAVAEMFRQKGIEIPFPQIDVHIRNTAPSDQAVSGDSESSHGS